MNINDEVYVRLTPQGEQILREHFNQRQCDNFYEKYNKFGEYYEIPLWDLMYIFGQFHHMGMTGTIFHKNEILLEKPRPTIQEWADSLVEEFCKEPPKINEMRDWIKDRFYKRLNIK